MPTSFTREAPVQRGIIETILSTARASENNLDEIPSTNDEQPPARKAWPSVAVPTVKSLYIETYFGEQKLSSATCFLLSRTKESHCVVVTNRHVVTGRHQDTDAPLDRRGGIPDAVVIHFNKAGSSLTEWVPIRLSLYRADGSPCWIEHPQLGAAGDLVALNVRWGSDVEKLPYYLTWTWTAWAWS